MAGSRKRHPAAFKAKVALEAAKQTQTVAELAKAYQVHPVQISQWKKQLLDGAEALFRDGRRRGREEGDAVQAELYQQIGRLNMEVEWLKIMRKWPNWSRAWRPTSGSTTRSVLISPWAIGLRGRSIEPGLAEAERGTSVPNPG